MGALHGVDTKNLRRLRGPIEFTRRRLNDIIAIDDFERVDRGLTAHDTVEGTVAHEHVDSVIDGLGRNERTSAVVNGDVFKACRYRMHAGSGGILTGIAGIGKADGRIIVKRSMARRRISARRSTGHTTTMWPTLSLRSNARMDQLISGRPATLTSCLPPGFPKRWPLPPATTTAHTGAIMRSPVWCLHAVQGVRKNGRVVNAKVAQALRILADVVHELLQRAVLVDNLLGHAVTHDGHAGKCTQAQRRHDGVLVQVVVTQNRRHVLRVGQVLRRHAAKLGADLLGIGSEESLA